MIAQAPSPKFQSTHPRRVRRAGALDDSEVGEVSIHAPAKGATRLSTSPSLRRTSFNPRTREGCDRSASRGGTPRSRVSIHAPAKGATCTAYVVSQYGSMFQSTHPRRVRPVPASRHACAARSFNPRTREGCDRQNLWVNPSGTSFQSTHPRRVRLTVTGTLSLLHVVSIHAPAKGATGGRAVGGVRGEVSIHAPAKGATGEIMAAQRSNIQFQSTHPRRVRPTMPTPSSRSACFNPRTREGCDLTGGACRCARSCFNPRTREGCDVTGSSPSDGAPVFQSTHPRRVRPASGRTARTHGTRFQSTHPRRVRRSKYTSAVICRGGLCSRRWRYTFMKRSTTSNMASRNRFLREPPAVLTKLEVRATQLIPISTTSPLDRKLF